MKHLILFVIASTFLVMPSRAAENVSSPRFALAIHGGAGVIPKENMTPEREAAYRGALAQALQSGHAILKSGGTSMDAVVVAIKILEDSPLFNAGRGAVLTSKGTVELDASLMEGKERRAGAVAGVTKIKNPIEAARLVMEKSPHVLMIGEGAEKFLRGEKITFISPRYFITTERKEQLKRIQREEKIKAKESKSAFQNIEPENLIGTVGAVAVDQYGNLAAGTSTGGMVNKKFGRVGDSPIIGAGTYADNKTCAVSATGHGEFFIRAAVAHDISALIEYKKMKAQEAADEVVMKKLKDFGGTGGVIVMDATGNIAMPFNTPAMHRGYIREDGKAFVAIYREELQSSRK